MIWICIMLGGALGACGRHAVSILTQAWVGDAFPWGTLFVNTSGSLAIGFLFFLTESGGPFDVGDPIRAFLLTGVLGGFTTFSAFSLQTLQLLESGQIGRGLFNAGCSIAFCLAACALGIALARAIP